MRQWRAMVAVCLCAALGPCISVTSNRTFLVVQMGKENNEVKTTVDKTESFDGRMENKLTGIEASATANATIGGTSSAKDAGKAFGKEAGKAAGKEAVGRLPGKDEVAE